MNEYQTELTEELVNSLPQEVQDQLFDTINNIEFIKRLISPDREYAKDRPRDKYGRIIVDLANPHILEDMDYFRPTALHYQRYGTFTNLKPNSNPNSEYGKWIREEVHRCWKGYIRESDGEWVTGYMYFYLNYCPIILSKIRKGTKQADRVFDFPEVWEGIYWRFHYIDQMRNGGLYNNFEGGNHGAELARRGASKSYSLGSIAAHNFILGENETASKRINTVITAYQKEYLTKDGTLNKFLSMADFCAENTQFPRKRLKSSIQDMVWAMGYKDVDTGVEKGTQNSVLGVSSKDDESKMRGKRAHILVDEFGTFPRLIDAYNVWLPSVQEGDIVFAMIYMCGCCCAGTKVLREDGSSVNIEDVKVGDRLLGYDGKSSTIEDISWKQPVGFKDCVRIYTEKANYLDCSTDHPILALNKDKFGHSLGTCSFYKANELKVGDTLLMPKKIGTFGHIHEPDAFLLGALFGDGSYSGRSCVTLSITSNEEYEYYNTHYDIGISKIRDCADGKTYSQIYFRSLHPLLKKYGMDNQSFENKKLPANIFEWDKESVCKFLGGYFTADGNVQIVKNKHRSIKLTCKYENTLIQIKQLLSKLGISAHIYKEHRLSKILKSVVNNTEYFVKGGKSYVLYISNSLDIKIFREHIKLLIKEKQDRLDSYTIVSSNRGIANNLRFVLRNNGKGRNLQGKKFNNLQMVTIKSIEPLGIQQIYNMTADTTHTYISNGFISSNTAGDSESDFAGAQEIMYNPKGYNMYALPNVYDRNNQGRPYFVFFFPGYINRKGCYNENGVSDVIKALIEIFLNRYRIKYNSTDPNTIIKTIAEIPITPSEAIIKTGVNMFPVTDLSERLGQLDSNPREYDDVYVGELLIDKSGKVDFKPSSKQPIRDFPHKDNKIEGAVEIYKMPEKDKSGKVFDNRYICGNDPYDDDSSDTMSLGSMYILDLWTDTIVAEYTGRPVFAEDFYEICRKMCLFYNARMNYENNKKGLFAYFSKMNCLYLLSDTLDFLRDKDMIKGYGYGNKAHPYTQKVYTPDGIRLWGDIKVGDKLFNTTGGVTTVTDIPFDAITDIYEITLKDGRKVRASENHLWNVIDWNGREKVLSTKDMLSGYYREKGIYKEYKYYIPKNMGVEYRNIPVELPPYFMGIMLGDGCFTQSKYNQANFTSSLTDMESYKNDVPYEYKTYDDRHHKWLVKGIGKILTKYNLIDKTSHTKFIPDIYKYNSKDVRLNLLQGLLDTDGHIGYGGNPEYITVSEQLSYDVLEVARSLGINCNRQITNNRYGKVFKIVFYTDIKLFKLNRKASRQKITKTRAYKTAITNIKLLGKEQSKCVTVDSKDSCYLIGDFVTTHNSKGTNATAPINAYARNLLRSWLLKPVSMIQAIDGEEKEVMIPNLYRLRSRALIKELILYNSEGNFDRISAMGMLMLLREDKMILYNGNVSRAKEEDASSSYLGNDPFFKTNYDLRLKNSFSRNESI